jgi:hypothetical protein
MATRKTTPQTVTADAATVPHVQHLAKLVYGVRNEKVLIDTDLTQLYGVETGALNRAVKRNASRFPADFMFQLSAEESDNLKCQSGIASAHGGRRAMPYAFTEQCVGPCSLAR